MNVTTLGTIVVGLAVLGARDVAQARGQGCEQRVEALNRLGIAADHHAVTALQAPDTAGGTDVDVVQAFFRQGLRPADIVFIEGVAAVDDGIAGIEQGAQGVDGFFGRRASWQHDPDRTRPGQAGDQRRQIGDARGALCSQGFDKGGIAIVNNGGVPVEHQAPRNIAAHAAQSNNPELHVLMLPTTN
ncbi:hypothetical protein D9M69_421960 [compost metagenome]